MRLIVYNLWCVEEKLTHKDTSTDQLYCHIFCHNSSIWNKFHLQTLFQRTCQGNKLNFFTITQCKMFKNIRKDSCKLTLVTVGRARTLQNLLTKRVKIIVGTLCRINKQVSNSRLPTSNEHDFDSAKSLHIFTCLNYSARDQHKFAVSALPGICQYIVRWMFEGAEALSWTCAASKALSSHLERAWS